MNCMLKAFSYCTDLSVPLLIKMLGHDGSEIVHPDSPSPFNTKSFTVGEFAGILFPLGYKLVHIYDCHIDKYLNDLDKYNCVLHNTTHCVGAKYGKLDGYIENIEGIIFLT